MKRSDLRWSQLKVAMLLIAAFLILVWVAFNSDLFKIFRREAELAARFPTAEGLVAGNPVFFLGLEAGKVESVEFDSTRVTDPILLRFKLRQEIRNALRADAHVEVASFGVLGDKFLEVVRGTAPAPLPRGVTLPSRTQPGFASLVEPGTKALSRVDSVLSNLEEISGGVRHGEGSLGKLVTDEELHSQLVATLDETRATLADLRRTQSTLGKQLADAAGSVASTSRSFDSLATNWRRGNGTLNRLAEDPALYDNLNSTTARLDRVLTEVERGDGLLARLLKDPEFANQATGLVVDLRALLQDMRQNPGKYVQFSVF
jgi:phospholipid/cholesterol/gamma-HCH transport system substrate-binding protein